MKIFVLFSLVALQSTLGAFSPKIFLAHASNSLKVSKLPYKDILSAENIYQKVQSHGNNLVQFDLSIENVKKAVSQFNYGSITNSKLIFLGEIKEIQKDDSLKLGTSAEQGYRIFAYDLLTALPISMIPKHLNSKNQQWRFRFYHYRALQNFSASQNSLAHPIVYISPSIKGIEPNGLEAVETKWAEVLAFRGIDSVIMSLQEDLFLLDRPLAELDYWVRRQITGLRLFIDLISTGWSDIIDLDKMGAMGASLGGIRTSILMSLETERIKAGIIIAAGGNFPDLWVSSDQKLLEAYRENRIKIEKIPGKNKDEKLAKLYSNVLQLSQTDPIILAKNRFDFPKSLYLYMGSKDTKVPTKNQIELWDALERPPYLIQKRGHASTIFNLTHSRKEEVGDFFERKFKE